MRFFVALLTLLPLAAADHGALREPDSRFWRKHAPAIYRVRVESTQGAFILEVHRDWAPIGADRFYNLVRAGFYDDSRFFRVTSAFRTVRNRRRSGDRSGLASGRDCRRPGAPIQYARPVRLRHDGPNARTTQIYICKTDMRRRIRTASHRSATVIEGMDVVDRLYAGYGETAGGGMRGGKQGRIFTEGNAHLDRDFPKLEKLMRAHLVR